MSKLFKKTLIVIILLFAVMAPIISGYAGWILYDRIIEEYESKAIAIANHIAHSSIEIILNRDASTIQSIVDQLQEIKGLSYVLVVNKDGEFLSHTFAPAVPHELRKLVEQPRDNKGDVLVTKVRLKQGNYLDISSPILSGVAGRVHIGMDLDQVMSYIWQTLIKLHAGTFLIFLVSVGIAFVFTNTISRPLIELTHYADKVANREFDAVVDTQSQDEVGILARTMTNMASEIETRMETLEREVSDATQQCRDALAYVSAIIDNLADGLLVIDSRGIVLRSNAALVKMLELDQDPVSHNARELLGQPSANFLQLKGLELVNSLETAQGGQSVSDSSHMHTVEEELAGNSAELTTTRADGSRFPVRLSASVFNMKGVWYTVGIVRDITVRKRAEEALRLSEEKYRGIFEHAVDGIFQTDERGRLVNANPASAHILGYRSPEELLQAAKQMGNQIYVNPSHQEEFIRLMRKGQIAHSFELELRRKDGTPIWASLHARPVLNDQRDLIATEGIFQDVTEKKQAQEALLESERRYRELFDISPDPMIVHREGIILFGNAAASRFFRVGNVSGLTGLPLLDFVHPEFREVVSRRIREAEHGGIVSDFAEVQLLRADGSVGYLESVALPTIFKGERAVLSLGRDVTERKEAEEALRTSEERFRTIFEIAPDCIFLKDVDLRYTHVNPAGETLFGAAASEIIGKRAEDFFGTEAASHIREGDLRVLAGETIEDEHTRPVRGMNLTFQDIRTPLKNSAGVVVGLCKFSRNITDRKGVEPTRTFKELAYSSKTMAATLERARQAAETDGIVLLLGESGSGKDYLARWIHKKSKRADGPFFSVNCAAIPRELAESELFGHERGAFTGAVTRKRGLLELAEGGTLLLNEVGELPLNLQSKLLTFLDTRSFTRVGGEKDIRVHARLIAATHRDLQAEVQEGRFLEALYYRLNVYAVRVPPLRERLEDLPVIVEEILLNLATEMQLTQVPAISAQDMGRLASYNWPGNARELRNVLERAAMVSKGAKLEVETPSLSAGPRDWSYEVRFPDKRNLPDAIDEVTRSLCVEALRRAGGNRKDAATLLGISRQSLYRYLKEQDFLTETETSA